VKVIKTDLDEGANGVFGKTIGWESLNWPSVLLSFQTVENYWFYLFQGKLFLMLRYSLGWVPLHS